MVARFWLHTICAAAAAAALAVWAPALAESPRAQPPAGESGVLLAQSFRETPLNDLPAVDRDRERAQPPTRAAGPPPPPPIPRAPRVNVPAAPPPADDGEAAAPPRDTPPPAARTPVRVVQPPPPPRRAAPDDDEMRAAPPVRRTETQRRAPPARSSFYASCTAQCHLACEASFEGCNGDSSPAKPECVRKLEACRVQQCSCRLD